MIDEMVANLTTEQLADEDKPELELSVSDSETAIEEMTGSISTLTEEIAALEAGIKKLDKSVAEATEQRKDENADYKELKQSDTAAKEVLLFAKKSTQQILQSKVVQATATSGTCSFRSDFYAQAARCPSCSARDFQSLHQKKR